MLPRVIGWLWKWYGYLLIAVLILTWGAIGRGALLAILALVIVYFAVSVPSVCFAITRRGQLCRNNAKGIMMGCHLREHRWQKWRLALVPHGWRRLGQWLLRQPRMPLVTAASAVVAALATAVQAAAAVLWHA